jgi:hypothetical protein
MGRTPARVCLHGGAQRVQALALRVVSVGVDGVGW